MKKKRKLRIQDNDPKDKILQSWEKFEEKYGIREIKDDKTENFDENSEENTVSSESSDAEKMKKFLMKRKIRIMMINFFLKEIQKVSIQRKRKESHGGRLFLLYFLFSNFVIHKMKKK